MTDPQWFDDLPVVGALPPAQQANTLRALGETDLADDLEEASADSFGSRGIGGLFQPRLWQHTAHAFGYFAPGTANPLPIQDAGSTENLHFNATYRVRQGEQAGIRGYPIFLGLNVGANGVMFRCFTVAVSNSQDSAFLGFLDSDVFKAGLKLVNTLQPAVAPLSEIAYGLTRGIAKRNQNVPVQDIQLGLDFTQIASGARLAVGSYLAVQIPASLQAVWDWREYVFAPNSGQVVRRDDPTTMIPYNYLVFSISRYDDETTNSN